MKTTTTTAVLATTLGAFAPAAAEAAPTVWDIDTTHSAAHFKVRHLMVSNVRGQLGPVSGTVWIDEQNLSRSRVDVSIDVKGVDTRLDKRDEHLRSEDFFFVSKYPKVTFTSTAVKPGANGHLAVTGDLTIRGITRKVTLDVEPLGTSIKDPWGNVKRGASAHTRLSRKEFGLLWNPALETGGVVVGDEVEVDIEVELAQQKPANKV